MVTNVTIELNDTLYGLSTTGSGSVNIHVLRIPIS